MSSPAPDIVSLDSSQVDDLAHVYRFIRAHETEDGSARVPSYFLTGAADGDQVELTGQLHEVLKRVARALSEGKTISVTTQDEVISTQQAADLLGMSRPTVVRLIEAGELPAHVPGTERRKLLLVDVLAYRDELYERRNTLLDEFNEAYGDIEPDEAAAALAEVRRTRR